MPHIRATDDIPIKSETHESSKTLLPQHEGFPSRPPMSPLGQIHHPHPIPLDSQAHVPVTKPAETEEAAFCINAKQIHRIFKRRATRQKFEENFGLNGKSRKPYRHESLHNHAMRSPRGPGGRFLARAEVAAMANGTDGEGDEGCVNDARGAENTKSIISTTICPLAATFQGYINTEDVKQGRFLSPSQHHELGRITPRDELITQKFDAPINTTGVNSTLDHFHSSAPMTYGYSSPVVQQGEISMDYSTEITGFYYAHQHPLLSFLQPQYEEQQHAILYSLPYYSDEQLATISQPSGTEILMQPMKVEPYGWDLTRCPLSMCPNNVQDLEKADIERHI